MFRSICRGWVGSETPRSPQPDRAGRQIWPGSGPAGARPGAALGQGMSWCTIFPTMPRQSGFSFSLVQPVASSHPSSLIPRLLFNFRVFDILHKNYFSSAFFEDPSCTKCSKTSNGCLCGTPPAHPTPSAPAPRPRTGVRLVKQ